MVTNPATRDWTVTASLFATLNEMFGNRTVCGIGRGDSAVRVINGKPVDPRRAARVDRRDPRAGQRRGRSSTRAATLRLPVEHRQPRSTCGSRPTARRRWRWPARSATGSSCSSPTRTSPRGRSQAVREAAARGRPRPGVGEDLRGRPGVRRRRPRPTSATSAAGSAGWSATTSPTSSRATAPDGAAVPKALTDYIAGRHGLRLQRARPGRQHARRLRPRRDRRPVLHPRAGRRSTSSGCTELKALGVDQFAVYLQHDAKEETLRAYAEVVIPALRDVTLAKT